MISFNDEKGNWLKAIKLSDDINTLGQGNPYVTPANEYLFYASIDNKDKHWPINWVNFKSFLPE